MYKRFFSFGCSYTNYIWPTWADIMAYDMNLEYHNYGKAGFGNTAIQCEIIRADIEKHFNHDDLIIIMWSHWNREDRYINGDWKAKGNIFNNDFYDKSFWKKYWDFDNDIIKNSTAIISINKAYKDLISFQSNIMPPGDFESERYRKDKNKNILFQFYSPYLPVEIFNDEEPYFFDGHPSIKSYLQYVENKIYPKLGLIMKDETRNKYIKIDESIKMIDRNKAIKDKHHAVLDLLRNERNNTQNEN